MFMKTFLGTFLFFLYGKLWIFVFGILHKRNLDAFNQKILIEENAVVYVIIGFLCYAHKIT